MKDSPKILVVVPTLDGISDRTKSSLEHQTIPFNGIMIANKKIDGKFSTGERASKALNYELEKYTMEELQTKAQTAPYRGDILSKYVETLYEGKLYYENSKVLTDDYAPTENLLNPVTLSTYEWE